MRKKGFKKILPSIVAFCLILSMIPWNALAATMSDTTSTSATTELDNAKSKAKKYIDNLTINNSSNDPSTVVKDESKFFTWDNEKRSKANDKSYLYEWSYYNGVVFEGLNDIYKKTSDKNYSNYVNSYLSSMITDGKLNSYAGYVNNHGSDCYKTASILLDYGYNNVAKDLYQDLKNAQDKYTSSDRGGNYNHTWASSSTYNLWLDGLYMIQPFMAEYAATKGDTAELSKIVNRFTWVSENMYNESTGLFYHAANSKSDYYNNNNQYWGRAIGWYAAAMVDVMDDMDGDNLKTLKPQFKKIVDGMIKYQADDGMWRQFVNVSNSQKETSVTALMAYSIQKAVNKGWLDESYAQYAQKAFIGMCNYSLDDKGLHYICFKGSTSEYTKVSYDNYINEGKGVGPFIMAYSEMINAKQSSDNSSSDNENTSKELKDDSTGVIVESVNGTKLTVTDKSNDEDVKKALKDTLADNFKSYDITLEGHKEGEKATVKIPIPEKMSKQEVVAYYTSTDGKSQQMKGSVSGEYYVFETDHFSNYSIGMPLEASNDATTGVTGEGTLVGSKVYTLDTDGVDAGEKYLIVNAGSGTGYALTNNGESNAGKTQVSINNKQITVKDDANIAWTFNSFKSKNETIYWQIGNNNKYINLSNKNILNTKAGNLSIKDNSGSYTISGNRYYLKYNNGSWTRNSKSSNIYLYKYTESSQGAKVNFSITPKSMTLKTKETQTLNPIVTVAGEEVNISDCTIEWSTNSNVVSISNNQVTANKEGSANITAKLTAVNGTALTEAITLTVPVTVTEKTVTNAVLTGNSPITTRVGVEPDFSKIKLNVTYDDNTKEEITVDNGLIINNYDISNVGTYYADIIYQGVTYGTVKVTVGSNPYQGKDNAEEYPTYPNNGAVRIDKNAIGQNFSNTGVAKVELDVAGVSVKKGVDVVLVADISNSMAWAKGTRSAATGSQTTKWQDLKTAAGSFIDVLLEGDDNANTVSFVTFGGYDKDRNSNASNYNGYFDSVDTIYTSESDSQQAKASINAYEIKGDDTAGYTVTKNGESLGSPQGGTNYDYAFLETASAINKIKSDYAKANNKSYDKSGREIYVVFMTDGAPDHYNQLYYKSRSNSQFDYHALYRNSSDELNNNYFTSQGNLPTYNTFVNHQTNGYYIPNSGSVTNTNWAKWITSDSLYAAKYVKSIPNVNSITNIGFDLSNGGFSGYTFEETDLNSVLRNLAGENSCNVFLTNESDKLNDFYKSLATSIKYAGSSANVTDTIKTDYTLQLTPFGTGDEQTNATIDVTAYDLWTKSETNDSKLIGTRKKDDNGNYISTVLESVTFTSDGKAYSTAVENGNKNILTQEDDGTVTISGHYFTYTKDSSGVEKFNWDIGNITDKEVALSFYVYLKGSLEGEREQGLYYTNEGATLEYIDINDKHATKEFPVPALNWGGASTAYEFYLVNKEGIPVDRSGKTQTFANRTIVYGPEYQAINLNADLTVEATIKAKDVLPAGYVLYDDNAYYTVKTRSGDELVGDLIISEPSEDAKKDGQTGADTTLPVSFDEKNYTQSRVAFAVRYDSMVEYVSDGLESDKVVIDYGKSIQADVLANDKAPTKKNSSGEVVNDYSDYTRTLVGFTAYNKNADIKQVQTDAGEATYTSSNGIYTIVTKDGKQLVNFQLTNMLSSVEKVFCVVKYSKGNDTIYLYEELDIIPATVMYYETDFASNIFKFTDPRTEGWVDKKEEGATQDSPQDDGTIGVDQTYGYDSTYRNDTHLSNASSYFVEGQGRTKTYVNFEFTGTGFDLISRTGAQQGAIRVDIYKDSTMTKREKSVTVINKSESDLELYQIPVVSVNDLPYGKHFVKIGVNASYTDETNTALSRGNEFYFDAIRIYKPLNASSTSTDDNKLAYDAYKTDNEADSEITEVREKLINNASYDITSDNNGLTFVDRNKSNVGISDYKTIGPNNEVYLKNKQAVAFKISTNKIPKSLDIGAKSADGLNAGLKVIVSPSTNPNDENAITLSESIATSTSLFYPVLGSGNSSVWNSDKEAYIFITNTNTSENSILSITDIKVAYGKDENQSNNINYIVNNDVISFAKACFKEPEVVEANYDIKSAEFTSSSCKLFKNATMTVVTTKDVEELKVTNNRGKEVKADITSTINEDGMKVWTVKLKQLLLGTQKFTVTGYGADGTKGASATDSIKVKLF